MKQSHKRRPTWRAGAAPGDPGDWVGGRAPLPFYVDEGADPLRPEIVMWLAGGQTVAATSVHPGGSEEELAEVLLQLLARPRAHVPPPRRIRVASAATAARLREVLGGTVTVNVGPTPEIAAKTADFVAALPSLAKHLPEEEVYQLSFLAHGKVPPVEVAAFFQSMGRLFRAAPWEVVLVDSEVLGMDMPAHGMKGCIVSIVGQSGLSRGAVVHASFEAFRRFLSLAGDGEGAMKLLRHPLFAVDFAARDDLPAGMWREVLEHGFPLPTPELVPAIVNMDADGVPKPYSLADLRKGRAVAEALARFFEKHRRLDFRGKKRITERIQMDDLPGRPFAVVTVPPGAGAPARDNPVAREAGEPRPTTPEAIRRVLEQLWIPRFQDRHKAELGDALGELADVLGDLYSEKVLLEMGSLPLVWAACWRPMADGRTGLSEARDLRDARPPVAAAAVERLARARGVFVEVVHLDAAAGKVWLRDLLDGSIYEVNGDRNLLRRATRHARMFGVLVDLGDGTWHFPTVMLTMPVLQEMAPGEMLRNARRAVTALGLDVDEIPEDAPHVGLARWAGVVAAEMFVAHANAPPPRRKRLVTSEGHAVEMNTAVIVLPPGAVKALWGSKEPGIMASESDLVFVDSTLTALHPGGESVANIQTNRGGKLQLHALSRERLERALDRIQAITGVRPDVQELKRDAPPGSTGEGDEGVEDVVIGASAPMSAAAKPSGRDMQLRHLRAQLDQEVPMLKGVPRALVATEAGRAAVERWLRDAERSGVGGREESQFLDLDPLRAELRLPTIASAVGR